MRILAAPFSQPGADRLLTEPWQLAVGAISETVPEFIPHWDANVNLRLARSVIVDIDGVRADCGIVSGPLRLVAAWRSSGTWIRGVGTHLDLPAQGIQVAILQIELPGSHLAEQVEISTQLILATRGTDASPAPQLPGSILWQDSVSISLEGTASRFPIEIADFDTVVWAPGGAGWLLVWNSDDLGQPLLKGLRLFLNARHPAVVDAVQATLPTPEQRAIRSAIYYAVGGALTRGALSNEEFVGGADYAEGTIGSAIRRLIGILFPGQPLAALRHTQSERPDFFDSMLQSALRLFVS